MTYLEEHPDRGSAMRREFRIKRMGRKAKEKLVSSK
jgi:predicted GIY-YIG superfamily endonuclease